MAALPKKIPILSIPDKPLVSTTQDFIPIADITNDFVLFKDGGAAIILESTSLNFGLLSEREQEAVVSAYAALINSLSFPLQILVKTKKKDISNYLTYFDTTKPTINNPKLQALRESYKQFVTETIKKRKVLGKRFFIVIPFSPLELGLSAGGLKKKESSVPYTKEYVIKKVQTVLIPKRDHLIRQAGRLGLRLTQLNSAELLKLFYDVYNPNIEEVKLTQQDKELAELEK